MDPVKRGQLTVAIERMFRDAMLESIQGHTTDRDEQEQIAGAVLALMLRKMTLTRGTPWLEAVLQMVLQPPDAIAPATPSRET